MIKKIIKPYIKIINGLVQIPQLIQKLIDSGLIETVKLINDLYFDDFEAISLNFDTLRKISNLKIGREVIFKKNLIPNILKNIKITAAYKKQDVILTGLHILDNLSRNDEGKEILNKNNAIENISSILDYFQNNDNVLRIGAKIYSKISTIQDILNQIDKLNEIEFKRDYSDLKELQKALVLISNFMLVDDICKVLSEENNLLLINKIFNAISNLDLKNKSKEYMENYILLNKYFMIIFHRLFNIIPQFFEVEEIKININNSIRNNWKAVCEIKKKSFIDGNIDIKSFSLAFSEYFSSFVDLFERNYQYKNPEENLILEILNIIKSEPIFLQEEKPNNSASRILKIAYRIKLYKIQLSVYELFNFMVSTVKSTENIHTLTYIYEILFEILKEKYCDYEIKDLIIEKNGSYKVNNQTVTSENLIGLEEYNKKRDILLEAVINFMNEKPKHRNPVNFF